MHTRIPGVVFGRLDNLDPSSTFARFAERVKIGEMFRTRLLNLIDTICWRSLMPRLPKQNHWSEVGRNRGKTA